MKILIPSKNLKDSFNKFGSNTPISLTYNVDATRNLPNKLNQILDHAYLNSYIGKNNSILQYNFNNELNDGLVSAKNSESEIKVFLNICDNSKVKIHNGDRSSKKLCIHNKCIQKDKITYYSKKGIFHSECTGNESDKNLEYND